MKLSTLFATIGLTVLGSIASSAMAQTTTIPAGCTWAVVSVQSGPTGAIVNSACTLGNGTTLALREQKYSSHSPASCNLNVIAPNHTWSGTCDSPQILKIISSCNTGASTIFQTGPGTPPFNVAAFCGTGCPYSVQPQSPYSYPPLKYTCL
jgi:hypothetical protein